MKRGSLDKLKESKWVEFDDLGSDLRVEIIPGAVKDIEELQNDVGVCRGAFLNFENFENSDGKPVENTLEARMELYALMPVRARIRQAVFDGHVDVFRGEGDAASD